MAAVALVNGVLCVLACIEPGMSPREDLHHLLDAILDAVEPPLISDGQTCRHIIAEVRSTGLTRDAVMDSYETIQAVAAGRIEWLRVMGYDFDVSLHLPSPKPEDAPGRD